MGFYADKAIQPRGVRNYRAISSTSLFELAFIATTALPSASAVKKLDSGRNCRGKETRSRLSGS
jgi:hypothetical protein